MTSIKINELVRILNNNGFTIEDDFSITFVDSAEHKDKYEETRNFQTTNGTTLNVDLDENENILSLEFLKFT